MIPEPEVDNATGLAHYHSPKGLPEYQALAVAYVHERRSNYIVYDVGIGKSHIAMASAALLFEDDLIDLCVIVCERNKVDKHEWPHDFATFTDLRFAVYHGTNRLKLLDTDTLLPAPQVIATTYETFRNDVAKAITTTDRRGKKHHTIVNGPLLNAIQDKRILLVYDEVTRLKNRNGFLYKAHDHAAHRMRKHGDLRVLGLTATPLDRSVEDYFNSCRIVAPWLMPTVGQFENDHVLAKNQYGTATKFKNVTDKDHYDPDVTKLADRFGMISLRKRKTDDDVRAIFPEETPPEYTYVKLPAEQMQFYRAVQQVFASPTPTEERALFQLYRQIAGHPMALARSQGQIAQAIVEEIGETGLEALGSGKTDALVTWLEQVAMGQGSQVIVFSFFPSVLRYIEPVLTKKGFLVGCHWPERDMVGAKKSFQDGDVQILLSSDAGQRGLNLPCPYVAHYDLPLNYSSVIQRTGRASRAFSDLPVLSTMSFIAYDTIEEPIARICLERKGGQFDQITGDDEAFGYLSAEQRRSLLHIARRSVA